MPLLLLGTGHIVPQTVAGRLFCMVSALFGIPLYALFLKNAGDHIINILRWLIQFLELKVSKNEQSDVKHVNIKAMISAFLLMTFIILVGALGSLPLQWTYFEGWFQLSRPRFQ